MAKRGPKPKSDREKRRKGTFRKDRSTESKELKLALNSTTETPESTESWAGPPRKPRWITGEAAKFWKLWAKPLADAGILTKLDLMIFSRLCTSAGSLIAIEKEISKLKELTIETSHGNTMPNPLYKLRQSETHVVLKLLDEFGIIPCRRHRDLINSIRAPNVFKDLMLRGRFYRGPHFGQ